MYYKNTQLYKILFPLRYNYNYCSTYRVYYNNNKIIIKLDDVQY